MSRKSKVDILGIGKEVERYLQEGKDERWIADKVRETTGTTISHVAIHRFKDTVTIRTKPSTDKAVKLRIGSVEEALDYVTAGLEYLEGKTELTMGERFLMEQKGKWTDRILKIQGLYAPESQVAVAVQINQGLDLKKALWEILKQKPTDGSS